MFSGNKGKEHAHIPHSSVPAEPHDSEARSILYVWTSEEDQQLKALYNQFGPNWQLISDVFNSSRITIATDVRAAWDCFKRWRTLVGDISGPGADGSDWRSPASPGSAVTRREAASKATMAAAPRKVTLQVAAARAAGGRRPMRHSIIFEVVRKLMTKRSQKPPSKSTDVFQQSASSI